MATKKFPSEMSSRGTVLGTDKILIYNATTGASDEVCTVAELFTYLLSNAATFSSTVQATTAKLTGLTDGYIPYHISDASGLADSGLYWDGTNLGVGQSSLGRKVEITGSGVIGMAIKRNDESPAYLDIYTAAGLFYIESDKPIVFGKYPDSTFFTILSNGNCGFNKADPNYLVELGSDSAGKPGAGGLWTVVSDERIKRDVELADLDICYDTIKNIPLKRFAWADGVYSEEQVSDRHNLGWIAQDVQKYFSKAVSVKPFTKANGEVIEDCLDLNAGQLNAALYGAVQACMLKIESLEQEIALLKQ